ncbi:MAG TPA: thiamine phosphate synthase [Gemmatimonadaceae bacterium]|nr:thiamine phosphate synthase [Gemmatimonadaceae bacterium]
MIEAGRGAQDEGRDSSPPPAALDGRGRVPGPAFRVPVVHAVTDDLIVSRPGFVNRARTVMGVLGQRGAVHLRSRTHTAARLYELAQALSTAQERTGAWLVVNDRVDIALAVGARAVQLTSRSMTVDDARTAARTTALEIGASVHSVDEALAAAGAGASWVVAGNVFTTRSHPDAGPRGRALIESVSGAITTPCIAIGGIKPQHVAAMRQAGAWGVAAISGIWGADDAEQAATDYLTSYDADGDR